MRTAQYMYGIEAFPVFIATAAHIIDVKSYDSRTFVITALVAERKIFELDSSVRGATIHLSSIDDDLPEDYSGASMVSCTDNLVAVFTFCNLGQYQEYLRKTAASESDAHRTDKPDTGDKFKKIFEETANFAEKELKTFVQRMQAQYLEAIDKLKNL